MPVDAPQPFLTLRIKWLHFPVAATKADTNWPPAGLSFSPNTGRCLAPRPRQNLIPVTLLLYASLTPADCNRTVWHSHWFGEASPGNAHHQSSGVRTVVTKKKRNQQQLFSRLLLLSSTEMPILFVMVMQSSGYLCINTGCVIRSHLLLACLRWEQINVLWFRMDARGATQKKKRLTV